MTSFRNFSRIYPIIIAIAAQLIAAAILIGLIQLSHAFSGPDLPVYAKLFLQAAIAVMLSRLFRLQRWWFYIQFLLPFLIFAALQVAVPVWIYPLLLLLTALVFWNSADDRVPLYLTNAITCRQLSGFLPHEQPGLFMDLGCGPAGMIIKLAKEHPEWQFIGVETSPALWLLARMRCLLAGTGNVRILRRNLWNTDLSQADYVYAFLSPAPMERLYRKLRREMPIGSCFISNSFPVPDVKASAEVILPDKRETTLFLYHIG